MHISAIFIIGILLTYSMDVRSAEEYPQLDTTKRTHFIVLIRDTGTMKKKFYPQKMIVDTLPKLLFEGEAVLKKPLNPSLPVYHPERDHLSVVFVGIHKDGRSTACKNAPALSALPKHLFQWQPVKQGQNQAAFTNSLRRWMKSRCRAQGIVSSTVLTETMILPYVQEQLGKEGYDALKFSRTILVILGNNAYYGFTIPSTELAELEKLEQVRDIDEAALKADAVNGNFHIVTPRDWVFTIHPRNQKFQRGNIQHGNTLRYRLAEVHPLDANVNNYLDYPKQVQLDRVALSNDKLQLVPRGGSGMTLRILPSKRLRPDKIQISFAQPTGEDWQLGEHRLPQSKTIDINACIETKKCLQVDNIIYIPLLGVVVDDLFLRPNDPLPTDGKIGFKVRFDYNARYQSKDAEAIEVYSHHYVDTDEKTIYIQQVKPFEIQKSQFVSLAFSKIVLDNNTLANEYDPSKDSPNGLTQNVARARIVAARESSQQQTFFYTIIVVVVTLVILLLAFYLSAYKRRFQPVLEWNTAQKIDIDFNKQPGARLLVGTLNFKNLGQVPWFGRLLRNQDYPDYQVKFSLNYRNEQLISGGLVLSGEAEVPLGFREVGEKTTLTRKMKLRVSHETPIYIFLATDIITDFQANSSVYGPRTLTFGRQETDFNLSVEMWRSKKPVATQEIDFELELVPEEPKPTLVTYQAGVEELYFNKQESLNLGRFRFESQAQHRFAKPSEEKFSIRSYHNNRPLPDDCVKLAANQAIEALPYQTFDMEVTALCDGADIQNPPPPSQDYAFILNGELAPGSAPGPHQFTLYRDPTRADLLLDIVQARETHRIHWKQTGEQQFSSIATHRLVTDGITEAEGKSLSSGLLELPVYPTIEFDANTPASTIFEIQIGNTGKVGRGWVKVTLGMVLRLNPSAQQALILKNGYTIKESLHIITNDKQGVFQGQEQITVMEGEPLTKVFVQLDAANTIEDIDGGRIEPGYAHIEAKLTIEIQDDIGHQRQHQLAIRAPIGLEKLPHPNWLCIDFGTSAIVAAIKESHQRRPYFLSLQKLVPEHNIAVNFEDYDPSNTEQGTDFLPSQVICNADLRQEATQNTQIRKGYPAYQPASLKPGDSDFIGLPATMRMLRENPGRVVYSLKSWLAQPSPSILLPEPIELFKEESRQVVETNQLPLDKIVESGFAALADGYITAFDVFTKGGQVILSHPNTFTAFHQKKLHDIAWKAFHQRLGIALPERLHLISESDAVAYHYCQQRILNNRHRTGWERLLVYDFGAGTLDLSLVHIYWSQDGVYPEQWQVENRLGVPIAGNHLDSLLARLVDQSLTDVLDSAKFEYRYPLVARQLRGDESEQTNHLIAVYRLWDQIRQTKQTWDGKQPFRLRVGAKGATELIFYQEDSASSDDSEYRIEDEKAVIEPSGNDFYLSIPSATVHDYPPLQEFIEFVTDTVVDELLQGVGIREPDVDTVVISGRGALWAGLRERVWEKFPASCDKPDLTEGDQVKSAVVSGAIAWQELAQIQQQREPEVKPRLAILREGDQTLVLEEDWQQGPIDLRASSTFSLVQVSHRHPDTRKDFYSLRCHFYIQLAQYQRQSKWNGDPRLFVRKEENNGQTMVRLENAVGQGYDFNALGSSSPLSSVAPWPIGQVVLSENLYC